MGLLDLITAILATYRIAQLLPDDEGPLFIFTRIRGFAGRQAEKENDPLGLWANLDSGINCVYCCGLYAALLVLLLNRRSRQGGKYARLGILWFALAGGQAMIQRMTTK